MWSAGQGDDEERFLADLRALRDTAALGYEELAGRAHYPSDVLKEAEHGPSLPGLPILTAYVRACEGDVPEWEERWRRLRVEVLVDPGLPVRPAGASPAAVAGARAGVGVAPPDAYDPERIRAALRGATVRTDTVRTDTVRTDTVRTDTVRTDTVRTDTVRTDTVRTDKVGAAGKGDTSWDTASDRGSTAANGNSQGWRPGDRPAGAAATPAPDPDVAADALRRDPFSSSWLDDSQPIPPVPDTGLGQRDRAGGDRTSPEDAGQAPPGWRDFWIPAKATAAPTDVEQPSAPPSPTEEPATAGTSWSAFAPSPKGTGEPARPQAPDPPRRAEPIAAQVAAHAPSQTPAEPAVPPPSPAPPGEPRPDRYYPLRLLAVIVVAALIGSVLVLLLR
jgi:hypothetical protein